MLIQMMPLVVILIPLAIFLLAALQEIRFRKTTYSKTTGNGYFQTIHNQGKYGEYLVYKKLRAYEKDGGKLLFNCYLPKDDGATSETDVILIHSTGIFAVESKNYSGWIFGSEKSRMWTQTLPNGKGRIIKKPFYNPIMQNKTHIKWLKKQVGENIPVYSIIAFSERCELKDITVESKDVKVIKRQFIGETVKSLGNQSLLALSRMDIERVYEMLYPYTQTTEYEKQQHIENIYSVKTKGAAESGQEIETDVQNLVKEQVKAPEIKEQEQDMDNEQDKKMCPRCGAQIVLRTARKGEHKGEQFYGCSGFPKCRYHEYITSRPQTTPLS